MPADAMSEGDRARPSPRAVARLASGVGGQLNDLREALQHALVEAEHLEATGRPDLAVAVLEAQREALVDVHQRLQACLADAAVEREAEGVVQAAAEAVPPAAQLAAASPLAPPRAGLRLLAALVAGVVGLVLLVVPEPDAGGLVAAADPLGATAGRDADHTTPELIDLQVVAPAVPSRTDPSDRHDRDTRRR